MMLVQVSLPFWVSDCSSLAGSKRFKHGRHPSARTVQVLRRAHQEPSVVRVFASRCQKWWSTFHANALSGSTRAVCRLSHTDADMICPPFALSSVHMVPVFQACRINADSGSACHVSHREWFPLCSSFGGRIHTGGGSRVTCDAHPRIPLPHPAPLKGGMQEAVFLPADTRIWLHPYVRAVRAESTRVRNVIGRRLTPTMHADESLAPEAGWISWKRSNRAMSTILVSSRERCAPMQTCGPVTKERCGLGCRRMSKRSGSANTVSSRLAEANTGLTRCPARMRCPPSSTSTVALRGPPVGTGALAPGRVATELQSPIRAPGDRYPGGLGSGHR